MLKFCLLRPFTRFLFGLCLAVMGFSGCARPHEEQLETRQPRQHRPQRQSGQATVRFEYPRDETLFPPEIAPPTFVWQSDPPTVPAWQITVGLASGQELNYSAEENHWTPSEQDWTTIKEQSVEEAATVEIAGHPSNDLQSELCRTEIRIRTAEEEVGAPLFFREVNLPFRVAVKDPAAYIRWRFGPVSSREPPPIVLEKLPVCGNCHSFSADGSVLAMEVDSGNDKGSYAIAPVQEEIVLGPDQIITWADFRREDNQKTFGLLCQASPDGRYVVGTVKDRALAVYREELAFSQLFFLVKGIMAIYDRRTETFAALPGADDPDYVQTNGTWSPDGKTIVFARSHGKAYDPPSLRKIDSVLVPKHEADEFLAGDRTFKFDLYRIPFNNGRGGKAEPIEGASNNGMSNYFAKFSPDGKWIVFCKARSFMLLQPDSELYIIPAEGGEARRLRCNTDRMNSWHSWSPNGKWLVFSSKAFSDYTQLFLTHIDRNGESTPPVLLKNFTAASRAANIPEFVNASPEAIHRIRADFLDDTNYLRAGEEYRKQKDYPGAMALYRRALEINPENALAHTNLGVCLLSMGQLDAAEARFRRAIQLQPDLAEARCNLGIVMRNRGKLPEAEAAYREAIRLDAEFALARIHLGTLLLGEGRVEEAREQLSEAVRLDPKDPFARFNLGMALLRNKAPKEAASELEKTIQRDANFLPALVSLAMLRATSDDDTLRRGEQAVQLAERANALVQGKNPEVLHALAAAYAEVGRFEDAVSTAELAAQLAQGGASPETAAAIQQALALYRQGKPLRTNFK